MASYFHDRNFQEHLASYVSRDRMFLKRMTGLLTEKDFQPRAGESNDLYIVTKLAFKFWRDYREPIGGMLRTECLDYAREHKLGRKQKDELVNLADRLRKRKLVAVEALETKVREFKQRRAFKEAIDQMIELQDDRELTPRKFRHVADTALEKFNGHKYSVTDYLETVEQRIKRRQQESLRKYMYLMIDPLDEKVKTVPRGTLSMVLAKYKMGKGLFFIHLSVAAAIQGYNVIYFTLEDPKAEVEDRLDAALTGLQTRKLAEMPTKLRNRFNRMRERLMGRIKIVDGTEGGMTVQMIDEIWEHERNQGFEASVVIVDYDDEVASKEEYRGESALRRRFQEVYTDLRQFGAKRDLWVWTGGQGKRGKENQMVVRGEDSAEDIGKIRKVALCVGVGQGPWGDDSRYLFIAAHKFDRSKIGWPIMGDLARGMLYDREATAACMARDMKKRDEE